MMDKIRITVLPPVKHSERQLAWINGATKSRLDKIAEESGLAVGRLTDYLLNFALDNVEFVFAPTKEE